MSAGNRRGRTSHEKFLALITREDVEVAGRRLAAEPYRASSAAYVWVGDHGVADGGNVVPPEIDVARLIIAIEDATAMTDDDAELWGPQIAECYRRPSLRRWAEPE